MEEGMLSMISYAKANMMEEESSDSNCSIYLSHPNNNKRSRVERFKGVVPQQNGHWGAQIYANHQRIWLGTFKSQVDAAMAYDSATIKLRSGGDSHRNFSSSNITLLETNFQTRFATDVILSMIRDGSYPSKFGDFLRNYQQGGQIEMIGGLINLPVHDNDGGFSCTLLFQKELTPSDVGKLNRLVIPKRYALKHFPNVPDSSEQQHSLDAQRADQVELEFYDRQMSLWKFRYCYWKSSQSFVFTRGWNRFVKEKGLRANDTIAFYTCENQRGRSFGQSFLVIDVALRSIDNKTKWDMGRNSIEEKVDGNTFVAILDDSNPNNGSKGFRLFGVQIDH